MACGVKLVHEQSRTKKLASSRHTTSMEEQRHSQWQGIVMEDQGTIKEPFPFGVVYGHRPDWLAVSALSDRK